MPPPTYMVEPPLPLSVVIFLSMNISKLSSDTILEQTSSNVVQFRIQSIHDCIRNVDT